ncbi:hypothetical protein KY289_022854 [Solanum tuberosum]|nr:hypothetical protein KY289_022854 [Solanum tuberosum]
MDSAKILNNVKHAPDVRLHLISVGVLDDEGYVSTNGDGKWKLIKGSLVVARGNKRHGLYWTTTSACVDMVNVVESDSSSMLWHKRLSHISEKGLNVLAKKKLLSNFKSAKLEKCEHCLAGKQNRVSFKSYPPSRKTELLELVHSDLCGPMKTKTLGGALYFVTFIDDCSRKLWVYVLKTKDQVLGVFKQFQASVERETGKKLKCVRTDNGGEYCGPFDEYCKHQGIRHQKIPPKTPQLNGLAERMNRTSMERVRCLLSEAKLPSSFWGEALLTAAHVINLSPAVALQNDVPNSVWYGKDVSYDHLRVFGCKAFIHVPKDERKDQWIEAMQDEMKSLHENHTYELVKLPKGMRALKNKWVFKVKVEEHNLKPRYKARLVVKGFGQRKGIDFDEIFSPVVKMSSIRTVLGLAASLNLEIEQMDVKTTFLHGDLEEEIYMEQPEGFKVEGKENFVCKLKKSLYGLKQAPRQWYKKFESVMGEQGYKKTSSDHCVFVQKFSDNDFIILLLYVDDMLIVGKNTSKIDELKKELRKSFSMKDLGHAKQILGMRITRLRDERKIYLSQKKYIERVLERFNMKNAKPVSTPLAGHMKLSKKMCLTVREEKESMAKVPYSFVVGSLMYAMVCTRPDIAHAVGVVSRFLDNPGKEHWEAVKWILRYLRGSSDECLCFGASDTILKGYTDADMAGDLDNRKSTTGYLFTFSGGAISWQSKLQKCVALSTTEAEYIAATEAGKEMIWLKRFFQELELQQMEYVVYCDSQSAIDLSKNSMYHARTKHIDVRYHWIRDEVENESFHVKKIHTSENPADMLTKMIPKDKFELCKELFPNLKHLELSCAYKGKKITCNRNGFGQLETLRLENLDNLESWHLHTTAMSVLKSLSICGCPKLMKIPERMEHIKMLDGNQSQREYYYRILTWSVSYKNAIDVNWHTDSSGLLVLIGVFLASARYGSGSTAPVTPSFIRRGDRDFAKCSFWGDNAGLWAMTRGGGRRVVQISAAFMFFFSILGKFKSIFASIPASIMAAIYCIFFRTNFILELFNDTMSVIFTSHATIAAAVAVFLDRTLPFSNDEARKDNGSHWWDKMVDAVVSYAVKKLGDFLVEEVSLRQSLKENVLWLRNELSFMQAFLKDAEKQQAENHLVQQWVFEITSVANEAVAILEAYSLDAAKDGDHASTFVHRLKACACICKKEAKFHNIGKNIQFLKERVVDISRKRDTYDITQINNNAAEGSSNRPNDLSFTLVRTLRRAVSYVDEDQLFVGFQEIFQRLLDELLKKESRRKVLSIYDCKYLVVVDDVWHREAWESLKRTLPDNNNGSRVILTTRKEDVTERVDEKGFSHKLRFLNNEESWDLLCKKLHPENKMVGADLFSPSMERLAMEMVDKCRGLPLAIVVLGGILSYRKGVDEWQKVKTHLWQHMKNDSVEITHILSLSYNDLSFELKQCFLYIGIFQEDHAIDAEKLMYLWLAEGFIPRIREEHMEDIAENFLHELIS